jgi:formamidase
MKTINIDRSRPLREQPKTGHNRWHPDIPPAIEVNEGEEVALETRDARERGYTREQAYCICSVAVDLRISNMVDVPNYVVSALLPEDIFQG